MGEILRSFFLQCLFCHFSHHHMYYTVQIVLGQPSIKTMYINGIIKSLLKDVYAVRILFDILCKEKMIDLRAQHLKM